MKNFVYTKEETSFLASETSQFCAIIMFLTFQISGSTMMQTLVDSDTSAELVMVMSMVLLDLID